MDLTLYSRLANYTNEYASWYINTILSPSTRAKMQKQWYPTTPEEMRKFHAMFIFMSIKQQSSWSSYWAPGVWGEQFIKNLFTFSRAKNLRRFLYNCPLQFNRRGQRIQKNTYTHCKYVLLFFISI